MSYFDELNNAELFATYAFTKPVVWNDLDGQAILHAEYGKGIVKGKTGVIFQIQYPSQLRIHCEVDFFATQLSCEEFTNISFPPKFNREYLIETLFYWELKQAKSQNRCVPKSYRRRVTIMDPRI